MKRFLCTTAMAIALAGGVQASEQGSAFDTVTFEQGDFYASDLIGMRIYNSETEFQNGDEFAADAEREWDDIGEINDIILSEAGDVRAVILGVGGFLGMGEKDVSISMDDIRVVTEENNPDERFLVVNTSKEMLENAPMFERNTETAAADENGAEAELKEASNAAAGHNTTEKADAYAAADTDNTDAEVVRDEQMASEDGDAQMKETETAVAPTQEEMDGNLSDTAAASATLTRPTVEREGYAEAEMADLQNLSTEEIEGSYVYGQNDETVGEIDTLILSQDGQISKAVINVGGFLGLGEKPVAVSFDQIQVLRSEDGAGYRFYIDSTEEKLESMEEYVAD